MAPFDQLTAYRLEEFELSDDAGAEMPAVTLALSALAPGPRKPRDLMIRERAYLLWEGAGRPQGKQDEHWLQAVREIDAEFPLV